MAQDCLGFSSRLQHSADLQGVIEDRGRPVKLYVRRGRKSSCCPSERLPVLEIAKRVGIRPADGVRAAGSSASPRKALRACCATKPVRLGGHSARAAGRRLHAAAVVTKSTCARTARCRSPMWTGRAMAKAMGLHRSNDPAHMGCPQAPGRTGSRTFKLIQRSRLRRQA